MLYADRRTHGQKDRQEDMKKLTVAFPNFASATKIVNKQFTAVRTELHCYCKLGKRTHNNINCRIQGQ